ncbi:MAG: cobyric acid synthase [Chloroflexi bacterium]|nr:cobyric acid synthase [Chloroflexota bacterium]
MSPPLGRVVMVQGTASSVGKSTLVAALCRIFAREGWRVAPFKAQNMALNSAVTADGGEIGRSTAVQAAAAGVEPTVDMNPILLKPEAEACSQLIVRGRVVGHLSAAEYYRDAERRRQLFAVVTESLDRLRAAHDLVVIEGAGSPAELNLTRGDLVNMAVARHARAPVLLVADIDRGGVFAALIGTVKLLPPEERVLLAGLIVNRFRGDATLFADGVRILEERTGLPVLGVIPYLPRLGLAEEDSTALDRPAEPTTSDSGAVTIVAIRYPRISNFDDLDPLAAEPGVRVRFVADAVEFGRPDLIVLPGSKSTIADLTWLRETGLASALLALADVGTPVIGLCGGFQMMGHVIRDPSRAESDREAMAGLGLLPVETTFAAVKATHQVDGVIRAEAARGLLAGTDGAPITGYEIHLGATAGLGPRLADLRRRDTGIAVADGALSWDGRRFGTYIHGLFHNAAVRSAVLAAVGATVDSGADRHIAAPSREQDAFDRLADHVGRHLDIAAVRANLGLRAPPGG